MQYTMCFAAVKIGKFQLKCFDVFPYFLLKTYIDCTNTLESPHCEAVLNEYVTHNLRL